MRRRILYEIICESDYGLEAVRKIAELTGLESKVYPSGNEIIDSPCFYEDSPEHKHFLKVLADLGIELPTIRIDEVWSHEELMSATLIDMRIENYIEGTGRQAGTKYDDSKSCPECRSRARQISDMVIDKKEFGKLDIALSAEWHRIASERFKRLVESLGLTGVTFRPTKDKKGRDAQFPSSYQMIITSQLPPMIPKKKRRRRFLLKPNESEKKCKTCSRPYLTIIEEHKYNSEELKDICDLNITLEPKTPTPNYFSQGLLLVKPSVYEMCVKNNIKEIEWYIVQVD